jgi:hypothetical protein
MALVLKDRVKQTASNPGTGTITLLTTTTGFQSFSAVGDGNTTYFAIVDAATGAWEVNYGTYTSSGTTLSRNATPLSSSAGGALVNFTGAVDVFCTYPSSRSAYQNEAGTQVVQTAFGAITATSAALTTGTVSTTPAANTDIANKSYVDGLVTQGISYHEPVFVESPNTVGNLTATYNNGASGVGATLTNAGTQAALTVDGVLMTVGKRVLVYNQTAQAENGVYTVTTVGTASTNWVLTRATDADTYGLRTPTALGYNDAFFVTNGDTGAGETYVCTTTAVIVFGTTAITFAQISSAQVYNAGTGLSLSPATTFNIANVGTAGTYGSASAVPVFITNAQGQVTSVTNTNIAIAGSAVTGAISGQAGSVANALTLGTYLTGTSFNGSSAVTATVDATSANTASKVVARDASGNFSAGIITATLSGNATNVSGTVAIINGGTGETTRQAAMDALAGAVTSGQYLRGNGSDVVMSTIQVADVPTLNQNTSGNATTATTATNLAGGSAGTVPYQSAAGTTAMLAAGSSGQLLQSNGASAPSWVAAPVANNGTLTMAVSGTGLSGSASFTANQSTSSTFTVTSNATSANTASTIVARDASGNFSAGTITATLSGNASTATSATSATSATTATTATTANALNTGNNYQVNSLGVGTGGSGTAGEIRATNNVTAYYSSDIKFKENVRNIPNAAATAAAIGGKLFDWKAEYIEEHGGEDGYFIVKADFGVIAQDVLAKFPVAVRTRPDGSLAVDYEKLSALALAANAEHEERIAKLEALVATLIKG